MEHSSGESSSKAMEMFRHDGATIGIAVFHGLYGVVSQTHMHFPMVMQIRQ